MPADYIDPNVPPGSELHRVDEPGGDRWHLAGKPIHAGQGLELLLGVDAEFCDPCNGGGRIYGGTDDDGRRCDACKGAGERRRVQWVRGRFEYQNTHGGKPTAWLYLPAWGTSDTRVDVTPGMRCRWPERAR